MHALYPAKFPLKVFSILFKIHSAYCAYIAYLLKVLKKHFDLA